MPASTNSTKRGQGRLRTLRCGAAANASRYAPDWWVPSVEITPTRSLRVAATARRTAGRMTSTTGTS